MKRQALFSSELAFDPGQYRLERAGKIFRLISTGLIEGDALAHPLLVAAAGGG